jgi:sporulation protein YlmC with PRC-barrel domain
MDLYMIRRRGGWSSPDELGKTADRSKQVADDDYPDDIAWIRSYVIDEGDGKLGTVCIYQASSEQAVRDHADSVEMPADEVRPIVDTVIIRPDPEPAAAQA